MIPTRKLSNWTSALALPLCFLLAGSLCASSAAIPCLSGFVRTASGAAIVGADLDFFVVTTGEKLITPGDNTDGLGFYSVCVLPGNYDVTFAPPPGTRLLGLRIPNMDLSSNVGQELDVTLVPGLVLDGLVRSEADGGAVPLVDIDVDGVNGGRVFTPGDNTAATGAYRIVVPQGRFRLRFEPPLGSRLRGVELDSVLVETDRTIDVSLPSGNLLGGSVRSVVGDPVPAVGIELREILSGAKVFLAHNETDALGDFSVAAPTGLFELHYVPPRGAPYTAVLVDSLPITADLQRDQILQIGHVVDIVVKDSRGATIELADIDVKIAGGGEKVFTPHDRTDAAGVAIVALQTGSYDFRVDPPLGTTLDRIEQFGIAIDADQTIEIVLPEVQRRTIRARAADASDVGIAGVVIEARLVASAAPVFIPSPVSDAGGNFLLSIPIGQYDVFVLPPAPSRWVPRELATVTVGSDSTWGTLLLQSGSFVNVHVSNESGLPLLGADLDVREVSNGRQVFVPDDETDAAGNAIAVLISGLYSIDVNPSVGSDYAPTTAGPVAVANDTTITVVLRRRVPIPASTLRLKPAVPNPFRQQTVLSYEIGFASEASLQVFDAAGRRVRTLHEPASGTGRFDIIWDGRGDDGKRMPSGVYYVRLRTSRGDAFRKVLLRK